MTTLSTKLSKVANPFEAEEASLNKP